MEMANNHNNLTNNNRHNIGEYAHCNKNNHYGNNNSMMLMGGGNIGDLYFHMNMNNNDNDNQIKMDGIDMNDFKEFDGDI